MASGQGASISEEICETAQDETWELRWERLVATNSVEIDYDLPELGWQSLMRVLENRNVTSVKHLILPMDFRFRSDADLISLARLLRSGRFSSLESLLLQTPYLGSTQSAGETHLNFCRENREGDYPAVQLEASCETSTRNGADHAAQHKSLPGTWILGRALVEGKLYRLRRLSVSNCYVIPILEAIIDSPFELRSFCMSFIRKPTFPNIDKRELNLYDSRLRWSLPTDQNDYLHYLRKLPSIIAEVFDSGRFDCLEHLGLTYGALSVSDHFLGKPIWGVLLNSKEVVSHSRVLKTLELSGNKLREFQLVELAKGGLLDTLEVLKLDECEISSAILAAFVDEIIKKGKALALERLELQRNSLDVGGFDAIVRLAYSNLIHLLQELNLSQMIMRSPHLDFSRLVKAIEEMHLPSLKILDWRGNTIGQKEADAILRAYLNNNSVVTDFLITTANFLGEPSQLIKASNFRKKNVRLARIFSTLDKEQQSNSNEVPESEFAVFAETTEDDPLELENWKRLVLATSRVVIKQDLTGLGWRSLMRVLHNDEVTHIRHLILPMDFKFRTDADLILLAELLSTGRFSSLETLLLQTSFPAISPEFYLNFRRKCGGGNFPADEHKALPGTSILGRALVVGNLHNLHSLSVSNCYVIPILEAIINSSFDLKSFCVSFVHQSSLYSTTDVRGLASQSQSRWALIDIDQNDYVQYLRYMLRIIAKVFESGRFSRLEHLGLTYGALCASEDSFGEWGILLRAMEVVSQSRVLKTLELTGNKVRKFHLEELAKGGLLDALEVLKLDECEIFAAELDAFVDVIIKKGKALPLKRLELQRNLLYVKGNLSFSGIARLANSNFLHRVEVLNLSEMAYRTFNSNLHQLRKSELNTVLASYPTLSPDTAGLSRKMTSKATFQTIPVQAGMFDLIRAIKNKHLPSLRILDLRGNFLSYTVYDSLVSAYVHNRAAVADILISDNRSPALSLSLNTFRTYREKNLRRAVILERPDEEEKSYPSELPVLSAKVFLCGFPGVGKTTLRKTLKKPSGIMTKLTWETRPHQEPRTKGIELCHISGDYSSLVLWDLAGQEEFHVLHGWFLPDLGFAAGKATTFVLVFKTETIERFPAAREQLLFWLRFVASSSLKDLKRHAVIVLNCFDNARCADHDVKLWKGLIDDVASLFDDLLQIRREPFIIDSRVSSSVKDLKEHLFEHTLAQLSDVTMPRICFTLQQRLKKWSERKENAQFPLLGWAEFESILKSERYDGSSIALDAAARFLHEVGEIIYFGHDESREQGSESICFVVPNPQWFCNRVVGQLLLPKEMTEFGERSARNYVAGDGSMTTRVFHALFQDIIKDGPRVQDIVSMLVRLGLCYRMGTEKIVVPALIANDDLKSVSWEGKGVHWVMGRSLSPDDNGRCSIPMTVFRRLQVELAHDRRFGGRGDSKYRAGKSFSSFNVGELLVLIQFDVDKSDPTDDRIDILVKSSIPKEDEEVLRLELIACICAIMDKLENLCVDCCPGLSYVKKIIKPWSARDQTVPMSERSLLSVREITSRVEELGLGQYTGWEASPGEFVKSESLLSIAELEEVKVRAGLAFDTLKHDAASIGLLTDQSLRDFDETEFELSSSKPPRPFTTGSSLGSKGDEVVNKDPLCEKLDTVIEAMNVIHGEVRSTRQQLHKMKVELNDCLLDAKRKQNLLLGRVQALQSFAVEEQEHSVPRFLFLSKRQHSKMKVWITLREAFETGFLMHLLCEARFDDGMLHEVEGQEGIEIKNPKEWLVKVAPWLRWSLKVTVLVAKIVGGVLIPGLSILIPNYQFTDGDALAAAVDTAALSGTELLGTESNGLDIDKDVGSASAPINLKEKMIAEAIVGNLMRDPQAGFVKKISLRKVLLTQRETDSPHKSSSYAPCTVVWMCNDCYTKYGSRARDITPRI